MNKLNFLFMALIAIFTLQSCSDDDDNVVISNETRIAFSEKYPSATRVSWENKGSFQVADFWEGKQEASAWFDSRGEWYMTEKDIPFQSLPQAVRDSFQISDYATWVIEDVDLLDRSNLETIYVIEVENQNQEFDLYYTVTGNLIKAVADTDDNAQSHQPQVVPDQIRIFVKQKYPQARIVDIEREHQSLEVNIIDNNRSKEVYFDLTYQWLYTSWDVHIATLPQTVTAAIENSQYRDYLLDEADFVETAQGNYYLLELENENTKVKVKVDEAGTIRS